MARTGRQPRSQPSTSTSTTTKKSTNKSSKGSKKSTLAAALDPSPALDVYSYAAPAKKPRGDVDPESRPSAGGSKGKGRREEGSDEEGSDEDEDDELMGFHGEGIVEFTGVKPKGLKMGMDSDDEGNAFDDDEEIDSDQAEEEDDFEDRVIKGNKKKGKSTSSAPAEIDLDENEIDWDDEEGEGYMDLAEMLDSGAYASDNDDSEAESGSNDSEVDSGSEEDDEDEEMDSASSVDEEYEGALDKLSSFVDGLESRKRKQGDDDEAEEGGKKKKRVVLKERTEAYPEGEFTAVNAADDGKLNLDDLLASFATSSNPRLAALRKSLKPLAASTSASPTTSSHSHLKTPGALAAPLPARLQDKIDREAAYEKTKEETNKWNETVRRMKGESGLGVEGARKERLTLPLMGGAGDVRRDPNAAEWSAKFQPTNALESSIQSLLLAGQMSASDLRKAEKTALAALDPADVAARQAELRQQRDLMYRAERKAKRVAKIKSKAFRRIHRRQKGKEGAGGEGQLTLEEMEEMDRLDGGGRVEEERARMEVTRAKERATLKHSSKGGRWSRTDIGGLEGLDEERNSAVRDMVARNERLRRRIAGVEEGEEEGDEYARGDSDEELDSDAEVDDIRRVAMDELKSLEAKEASLAASDQAKPKGVVGMKFMQDAIKRGDRKAQAEAEALQARLESMGEQASRGLDGGIEGEDELALSEQVQGNLGRMVFGPSSTRAPASATAALDDSSKPTPTHHTTKLSAPLSISSTSTRRSPLSINADPTAAAAESNPWLADASSGSKVSRKSNKATTGKDSRDASRMADKVSRHKSRQAEAREEEQDDATVEVDPGNVMAGVKAKGAAVPQLAVPDKKKGPTVRVAVEEDEASSDEEDGEEQVEAQRGKGATAFQQRDLVARAFAGDNVVADFEAEKRREVERDAPREEDNTLPGWGSWGGKGARKGKNAKKFITKIPGIAPGARQDANHTNVIISEKKDKKAGKYLLKDLPFPYTSAAQHEHKLRTPMGPEWSTSTILRDQTMPSVLIKPGVTIRPVDKKSA